MKSKHKIGLTVLGTTLLGVGATKVYKKLPRRKESWISNKSDEIEEGAILVGEDKVICRVNGKAIELDLSEVEKIVEDVEGIHIYKKGDKLFHVVPRDVFANTQELQGFIDKIIAL